MERIYYTLDDIRKELNLFPNDEGPYIITNMYFSEFLNNCLQKAGFKVKEAAYADETVETIKCFKEYIWPRFYQEAIIYTDSDEDEDFVKKFARTKVGQIMS